MAITQAMCTSFKKELLEAKHNFLNSGGDTFKRHWAHLPQPIPRVMKSVVRITARRGIRLPG